jgi:large subunit ribosomal protein L3
MEHIMSEAISARSGVVDRGLGLLGRKVGMTRIFTDDGESIPVTVLDVANNRVTQLKTVAVDGYSAVQVGFGVRRASRVVKAQAGHYAKAGVHPPAFMGEFRVSEAAAGELKPGAAIAVDLFAAGQRVDVTGVTIGKGFAGAIKRHHFSSNRATHGNSVSTNAPGSIGMRQDPGRVMPGKRMAGHLGDKQRTTQNLVVARVDLERQLLLVRGAVPGARGGNVVVRLAVKAPASKAAPAGTAAAAPAQAAPSRSAPARAAPAKASSAKK